MEIETFLDAREVAKRSASLIAAAARAAIMVRHSFTVALSGGSTPWAMLQYLAREALPWDRVRIFQVDERIAPAGDAERNWTQLRESLAAAPLRDEQFFAMPVEAQNLDEGAERYGEVLRQQAGTPPVVDLVQLGLGTDGHTASLVPGDAALQVTDVDVALTGVYQGRARMTLTYPLINRARRIVWVVTGAEKQAAMAQLRAGDTGIPAGRVRRDNAIIIADRAAAQSD